MSPELRSALGIETAEPVSGGCIHRCYRVTSGGQVRFIKVNDASRADALAAEADGLAALQAAGLRVPAPLGWGTAGGEAYLLLEYLDLRGPRDFAALGHSLAQAHRKGCARFGWRRDNYIGTTPQRNDWCDRWDEFWLTRRLQPQAALARRNGFAVDLPARLEMLRGHTPQPALVHGDLWRGNAGFMSSGPVLFDPAVYCGDREVDLAMTELFGGFPREFYAAYAASYPIEAGYAERKHLYNLYHLLNHLNLFGGAYLGQVKAALRLLL